MNEQAKKTRIQKKQNKLKKKREYLQKMDLKKIAVVRVKIFLVTRISGNKSFFFWPKKDILVSVFQGFFGKVFKMTIMYSFVWSADYNSWKNE